MVIRCCTYAKHLWCSTPSVVDKYNESLLVQENIRINGSEVSWIISLVKYGLLKMLKLKRFIGGSQYFRMDKVRLVMLHIVAMDKLVSYSRCKILGRLE